MKHMFSMALIIAFVCSSGAALADDAVKSAQKPMAEQLTGVWTIAPNARITEGTLEFKTGGKYEMNEEYGDGTGAGTKGDFVLDETTTPVRLKLCLGDCNQPGAEWVTRFCIVKMTGPDTLEIYQSKDGNYPAAFPEDKNAENYMMLTKK